MLKRKIINQMEVPMPDEPMTIEELQELVRKLKERIDAVSVGWARDVNGINIALNEMRRENRKLADRIEKLEKQGGLLNE